ncbi:MAG TPA: GTPase Era [Saprospiraceae bacterium]|nr:GTPase Era [Saprospiraceae bacterium]
MEDNTPHIEHKSAFVNILGKPNAGKSTLLNALIGTNLSITNRKSQTTRRRILGIWNDEAHQIVFSDTPGIIDKPAYKMQEKMNKYITQSFEDADIILFLADIDDPEPWSAEFATILERTAVPKILIINKRDVRPEATQAHLLQNWPHPISWSQIRLISALNESDTQSLLEELKMMLPPGPAYYPKDQMSDQSERFFVAEIIRKYILEGYAQEIPYSCEVIVEHFTESEKNGAPFAHIGATIFVSRDSQKNILIGKGGEKIKELGTRSRAEIETFLGYRVYLELHVKVKENWRNDENLLSRFGY